jgi:hypothetical protein
MMMILTGIMTTTKSTKSRRRPVLEAMHLRFALPLFLSTKQEEKVSLSRAFAPRRREWNERAVLEPTGGMKRGLRANRARVPCLNPPKA